MCLCICVCSLQFGLRIRNWPCIGHLCPPCLLLLSSGGRGRARGTRWNDIYRVRGREPVLKPRKELTGELLSFRKNHLHDFKNQLCYPFRYPVSGEKLAGGDHGGRGPFETPPAPMRGLDLGFDKSRLPLCPHHTVAVSRSRSIPWRGNGK